MLAALALSAAVVVIAAAMMDAGAQPKRAYAWS